MKGTARFYGWCDDAHAAVRPRRHADGRGAGRGGGVRGHRPARRRDRHASRCRRDWRSRRACARARAVARGADLSVLPARRHQLRGRDSGAASMATIRAEHACAARRGLRRTGAARGALALAEQGVRRRRAGRGARRVASASSAARRHEAFPDARGALTGRAGRDAPSSALVTNGASCLQREKLEASGLGELLRTRSSSPETSASASPTRAIFHHALLDAGLRRRSSRRR